MYCTHCDTPFLFIKKIKNKNKKQASFTSPKKKKKPKHEFQIV